MKLKENYVLRQVADLWAILPLGDAALEFSGMMTLNETGALLWRKLEQGADPESLAKALTAEYAVDYACALADVEAFLDKLTKVGCLEW